MKRIFKQLLLWYVIFVVVKSFLSYFVLAPSAFSDGYLYAKMARSLFESLTFTVHGNPANNFPPLYPLALSLAYAFKNMHFVYLAIKVINALLSSLIIFPAWLIAKEFMSGKKAFSLSILISLIPSNFAFAGFIMSENLFYTLFLFALYFIYKSFTSPSYGWVFLSGLFIGLTILTRMIGISLIPTLVLLYFINYFNKSSLKQKNMFRRCFLILLVGFIVSSPIYIKNFLAYGFSISGILFGRYVSEATSAISSSYPFARFPPRFLLYVGYVLLSTFFFFLPLANIFKSLKKNYKLFVFASLALTTFFFSLLIAVNHGISEGTFIFSWLGGRVIGRYIVATLPLIFILGAIPLIQKQKISFLSASLFSLIFIFASNLIAIPLFPINNVELTHVGTLTFLLGFFLRTSKQLILFAVLFGLLPFIYRALINRLDFKKLMSLATIFFIFLGILNYSVIAFNSYTYWYKGEQMQMGLWMNDNIPSNSNLLFDIRDKGNQVEKLNQTLLCDNSSCIMGFWLNHEIRVGTVLNVSKDIDFIISKHDLPFTLIKESGTVKVYKLK